jgi:hypothetical protein
MAGGDIFHSLVGDWTLSRVISPGIGTMTGTARFHRLEPNLLHYREDGRLELAGGHRGEAYREYHYLLEDERIRVCFVEADRSGRTLHTLRFAESATEATEVHLCGRDSYTGRYRFQTPDSFTIEMTVLGPNKDYSTRTSYHRLAHP